MAAGGSRKANTSAAKRLKEEPDVSEMPGERRTSQRIAARMQHKRAMKDLAAPVISHPPGTLKMTSVLEEVVVAETKGRKRDKSATPQCKGIDRGVSPQEYIIYRKCKYIEDIKAVRRVLTNTLNLPLMNGKKKSEFHNVF